MTEKEIEEIKKLKPTVIRILFTNFIFATISSIAFVMVIKLIAFIIGFTLGNVSMIILLILVVLDFLIMFIASLIAIGELPE